MARLHSTHDGIRRARWNDKGGNTMTVTKPVDPCKVFDFSFFGLWTATNHGGYEKCPISLVLEGRGPRTGILLHGGNKKSPISSVLGGRGPRTAILFPNGTPTTLKSYRDSGPDLRSKRRFPGGGESSLFTTGTLHRNAVREKHGFSFPWR